MRARGGSRGRGELLSCGGAYKDIAASTTQELHKVSYYEQSVIGARPSRPVSDAIKGKGKKTKTERLRTTRAPLTSLLSFLLSLHPTLEEEPPPLLPPQHVRRYYIRAREERVRPPLDGEPGRLILVSSSGGERNADLKCPAWATVVEPVSRLSIVVYVGASRLDTAD